MEFMEVTGSYFAPDGEPLYGSVSLVPSVPVIRVSDGAVVQSEVSFPVVEGKLLARVVAPSAGVQPSSWSYRVRFHLKRTQGFSVLVRGFDFVAQSGSVNLNDVAPVPSPVPGVYVTRGKSAYEVWLDAGNTGTVQDFLASLANGGVVPAGGDIVGVSVEGSKLLVLHANGLVETFDLPAGGEDKNPLIAAFPRNGQFISVHSDGTRETFELPAPTLFDTGWRDITSSLSDDALKRSSSTHKVLLRRIGKTVYLKMVDVGYRNNPVFFPWYTLPGGFQASGATADGSRETFAVYADGRGVISGYVDILGKSLIRYGATGEFLTYSTLSWVTDDPEPTNLPGSPV